MAVRGQESQSTCAASRLHSDLVGGEINLNLKTCVVSSLAGTDQGSSGVECLCHEEHVAGKGLNQTQL